VRVRGRLVEAATVRELVDETFQHAAALAAQALAGDQHPLVERRAVTQREALEQVAAVQRGRRLERGQAVGAQRLGTVTVGAGPGRRVAERRRVTPPAVADQLDQRAPGVQMPAVQGPVEHGQHTPERRAGAGIVAVRPQQCRQRFPTLRTLQRDVRQQRHGLAGLHRQRRAVDVDRRRTEHPQ
jgi:hypothetical protein